MIERTFNNPLNVPEFNFPDMRSLIHSLSQRVIMDTSVLLRVTNSIGMLCRHYSWLFTLQKALEDIYDPSTLRLNSSTNSISGLY